MEKREISSVLDGIKDPIAIKNESKEEMLNHVKAILQSFNLREKFADGVISQKEIKEIKSIKLSEYELSYLGKSIPLLMKNENISQLVSVIESETGLKMNNFMDAISVEMPDGRNKLVRHLLVELSSVIHDFRTKIEIGDLKTSIVNNNNKN